MSYDKSNLTSVTFLKNSKKREKKRKEVRGREEVND
jgi:hypothetical protein